MAQLPQFVNWLINDPTVLSTNMFMTSSLTSSGTTGITYSNNQNGTTVIRSNGGSMMTDTLPGTSPGVLAGGTIIGIFNSDAAALLVVTVGAGATLTGSPGYNGYLILGPLQGASVLSDGSNYFVISSASRTTLSSATTFYAAASGGSDSANTGLTVGSPFATIQHALLTIANHFDLGGISPTLKLADGTYSESFTWFGGFTGGLEINIVGNAGAPANVIWNGTLAGRDGGILSLSGIKFTSAGNQCLLIGQEFVCDFQNMDFGACAGGVHIQVNAGGYVNDVGGTYNVSGDCVFHWQVQQGGMLSILAGRNITIPNARTFTDWLYCQTGNLIMGAGVTFSGAGSGAGSVGKQYVVNYNGVASLGGATLPGATAGTTDHGGIVL